MDQTKAINRYRNLIVICVCLIFALGLALYESKMEQYEQQQQQKESLKNAPTQPAATQAEALFRIGDTRYSFDMLTNDFQSPLYQIRKLSFEQQLLVLEQAIVETYIANQIALQGNQAKVMAELFPDLSVSDEEVADYYLQNHNAQTPPLEALKPQLRDYLLALKQEASKQALLSRLLVSGKAQILFEAPVQPIANAPAEPTTIE